MAQDHVTTKLRELARQILLYQSFYFCSSSVNLCCMIGNPSEYLY